MFFQELLSRFARDELAYCVVGGVAVNLHGVPRMTYDIDLVVELDQQNLKAVEGALIELGLAGRLPVSLGDFSKADYREEMLRKHNVIAVTFTDPDDPLREVDVLVSTPVPASEIIRRAKKLDLEGVTVPVAALEDLIALKGVSERAQDKDDLELLQRIIDLREQRQ